MNKTIKKHQYKSERNDIMEQVPAIISSKDLSYLSDIFEWNFVAAKKTLHFSNEVTNEEIKKELDKTYKMHEKNLNKILELLK